MQSENETLLKGKRNKRIKALGPQLPNCGISVLLKKPNSWDGNFQRDHLSEDRICIIIRRAHLILGLPLPSQEVNSGQEGEMQHVSVVLPNQLRC